MAHPPYCHWCGGRHEMSDCMEWHDDSPQYNTAEEALIAMAAQCPEMAENLGFTPMFLTQKED